MLAFREKDRKSRKYKSKNKCYIYKRKGEDFKIAAGKAQVEVRRITKVSKQTTTPLGQTNPRFAGFSGQNAVHENLLDYLELKKAHVVKQ